MSAVSDIHRLVELLEKKTVSLKEKVELLESDNERLAETVERLAGANERLQQEVLFLKEKHEAVKMASSILGSSNEDKTKAKQKINALIREIDACIVQLSK